MRVWKCDEESVVSYLNKILIECKELLLKKSLEQVVVVIYDGLDHSPKERWAIRLDEREEVSSEHESTVEEVKKKFSDILKQIKASSNLLPLHDGKCIFDVLLVVKKDVSVPETFEPTSAQFLTNAEDLPFQALNVPHFKLDSFVTYKV
ncbi:DgyrCDS4663 [Dimorphilus gyrociliatus]|uniref:DgyrCDS4663 n=1 Tax=Dimorphilus gyrociliatus TaxID=2664684 RepID=A0A7I8VHQ4_9ANNE|nr:DgyrCDS4663 [Dimorphilus gyrociliatus]